MELSRLTKLCIAIPSVLAGVVLLYFIRGLIIPLIIAFIISFILSPIVNRLERREIKHNTGVIIIFICFYGLLILVLAIFIPLLIEELSSLRANLPRYITGIRRSWVSRKRIAAVSSSKRAMTARKPCSITVWRLRMP